MVLGGRFSDDVRSLIVYYGCMAGYIIAGNSVVRYIMAWYSVAGYSVAGGWVIGYSVAGDRCVARDGRVAGKVWRSISWRRMGVWRDILRRSIIWRGDVELEIAVRE